MSTRVADALLGTKAFGSEQQHNLVNPVYGGQMGFMPQLQELANNTQYIPQNIIPLVLEAPQSFAYLNNSDMWVAMLRSLIETHVLRITGLKAGINVSTASTIVGGAGEEQEDPTDVKRERSEVTFTWNEKAGAPVQLFHEYWIRMLIMDPNTKIAGIAANASGNRPTDRLLDRISATIAFIEPDPTGTYVVHSWIGCGMYPKSSGNIEGTRDIGSARDKVDHDIQYTGVYQYGAGVNVLCQKLLDGFNMTGANPYKRNAFIQSISAEVLAATKSFSSQITESAADSLK